MKIKYIIIIFLFFINLLPVTISNASAPDNIYLVTDSSIYEKYGFKDLGVYYTPESLCSFHMPFIVPKDKGAISKNELSSSVSKPVGVWDKKQPSYKYEILAENKDYYVIDYSMNIKASDEKFSIDFVPTIKGKEYKEFAYWSSSWDKRGQLHINHSQIDNELVDFPILVNFSQNTSFYSFSQSDLDDIRFVSSDNTTEFYHEIEDYSFDDSNNWVNASIWVQVDRINDDSDTYINVYYHNDNAEEQGSNSDVWNTGYEAVYHFNNIGSTLYDSTDNNHDGTITGSIGYTSGMGSPAFDFSSDKITLSPDIFTGGVTTSTYEVFYNTDVVPDSTGDVILGNDNPGGDYTLSLTLEDSAFKFVYKDSSDTYDGVSVPTTDTTYWHHLVGTVADNMLKLYFDGDYKTVDDRTVAGFKAYNTDWYIGSSGADTRRYDGKLTELRVSSVLRNESWLNASYNNLNNISSEFYFISTGVEEGLLSAPITPYANTSSSSSINLSWDMGLNCEYTYIERNTVETWNIGAGTLIYNNTGTYYTDTGLNRGVMYYYKLWGFDTDTNNFGNVATVSNLTAPSIPLNITGSLVGSTMNITWTKGTLGADNTLIIKKAGSFSSDITDGVEVYNDTGTTVNVTGTTSHFYTLWSFNETVHTYSDSAYLYFGSLTLRAFDENTSEAIDSWGVKIVSLDGSRVYINNSCNNSLIIDTLILPYGDNTLIMVNATDYETRYFYMDISLNVHYTLDMFLCEEDSTEQYVFQVVGLQRDYGTDDTVENAKINVKRYINETVGYQNVSIFKTDVNGNAFVEIIPNLNYLLTISADGYLTSYVSFLAPVVVYSEDKYHTFRIIPDSELGNQTLWTEYFDYSVESSSSKLFINTTDSSNTLTGINIIVYSMNNSTGVFTPIYWYNGSEDVTLEVDVEPANTYRVDISTNTSLLTFSVNFSEIIVTPSSPYRHQVTPDKINTLLDANYGTNPLGWSNTIAFILICAGLFAFGEQGVGITLMGTGFMFLFINSIIGIVAIGTLIPILFIVFGIFTEWIRHNNRRNN